MHVDSSRMTGIVSLSVRDAQILLKVLKPDRLR